MDLIHVVFVISSCLSVSCRQTTGKDTSFVTGKSFVEQTTEEFNRYCPYTETCTTDFNKEDDTDLGDKRNVPCCKQCSCFYDCGLNCCPDKLFTFTNEKDFYDAKELTRCVDAKYKPRYDGSYSFSFEMVSNCPFNYSDGRTVEQCKREYHEYDFQMPLRNFLPAYDQTKHRVYKNIFCAVCHNADINDLDFAFLTYSCENRRENLTYIHDLTWNVSAEDGICNFLFFPKELSKWVDEKCNKNNINQCNVTGKWKKYDRQLEEKCLSYRSEYTGHLPAVYKNVHCFLCNGFSENDINTDCDGTPGPFGELFGSLDFRNVFSKEGDRDHTPFILNADDKGYNLCQNKAIYNLSQVQIWNLECPFGMVFSDYICFPPSLPQEEINREGAFVSMYVSLLLEPEHSQQNQNVTSLVAFLSQVSTEVQNIFSGLVTKDVLLDYYITVSMDLKPVPARNTTIDFGLIKEIHIHTKVTLAGIKDAILPILDFTLLFNNVTRMGDLKVKIRRQIPFAHENIEHCCLLQDYLFRKVLQCPDNNGNAFNYCILIRGAKTNPYYYMPTEVIIGVEREPFCPRIALKKLAFVKITEPCKELQKLSQILTDNFLSKQLSENGTHIFFCYKDYLQRLEELKSQDDAHRAKGRNVKELTFIYLTIVCLSASIASLLTTIIIYALFSVLRTLPGLNIMALSITLLVYHFFSLVSTITFVDIPWLCSLIGIATHFFMIQSFGWMLICTYHMMKVFIKIRSKTVPENISRRFIIHVICAASVATILVAITIIFAEVRSGGQDIGYGGNSCYIKDSVLIMCVAALPVALVVILNFCFFFVVLFKISRLPSLASSKQKERQNFVIFVKLSTLTGLSSIFGFVFLFTEFYALGYLFVVLNGGQGVFIMISFIFNRRVRDLVQGLTSGGSRTGSSTVTTSTSKL